MNRAGDALAALISAELARPVSPGAGALAGRVRELYGDAVRGVLFYGSCLRKGDDREGVLDLYVLVDRYRDVYRNPLLCLANVLLPPNVFYLEAAVDSGSVRAKYAVLSRAALARLTSRRTFEAYFWARFAQPCALVYASDRAVADGVAEALAQAVTTFVARALPLLPRRFRAADLWTVMLRETYRCELRAERAAAPDDLYRAAPERYTAVTGLALSEINGLVSAEELGGERWWTVAIPAWKYRVAPSLWRVRRLQGKTLSALRVLRNGLIFEGGVEYVLWKIERHSGVKVDPSWRQKRFRLLALAAEMWRLYRAGAFR